MKTRAVVVLALIAAGCAARRGGPAGGGQASQNDGYGTIALAEDGGGCKKRYVTPYMKVSLADLREGRSKVTWILANACGTAPTACRENSKLELEFYKWEYTPEFLPAGPPQNAKSVVQDPPPPLDCALRNEVKLRSNVVMSCGASKSAKKGTYKFQVRFSCDGTTIDNWDPVIIFNGET